MVDDPRRADGSDPRERVEIVLAAIQRVVSIFWAERVIYLLGATAGMGLLLYAVVRLLAGEKQDFSALGLVLGSGGLFATAGGAVLLLLNRSFALIREIVIDATDGDSKP
jgi:hypothetical protein